ncbi:MAG: AroM family protein [Arenicellales bacterium]|nr:AroM family protein [Arenicellales bacterium]
MITERTLGIATIGQAPRDDIAALFSEQAPSSTRILLRGCLDNLTDEQIAQRPPMDGADTLVFACTGEFPPIDGDAGVIFPSRILNALAESLLPRGRLGLLIPLPEQSNKLVAKWQRTGVEVVAEALRPSADEAETRNAAERLAHLTPDLVAMDCMSYTPNSKAIVSATVGVPTLLAITATGRVIRELLE